MVWGAPRGVQDLLQRVQRNDPSLRSLCLMRGRRFEEGDALEMCEALAGNTVLRELSISSHAVGPAAAAAFARMLATNTTLSSLDLGNSTFGDEGLVALAPGIAASASLRQLNLERKGISSAGCASLAAALSAASSSSGSGSGSTGLEELLLGQNAVGAEGLSALLEGFGSSGGSSLRVLDLSACDLEGAAGAEPLAATLRQGLLPHLATLRLDGNELGAAGAAALAAALAGGNGASAVQHLYLQRCSLDGQAIAALAAALPPTLATLDLSGNVGMGGAGAQALAAALAAGAAPRLRRLTLCGCGLEDDNVAALAEALAAWAALAFAAEAAEAGSAAAAQAEAGEAGLALDLSGNSAGAAAVAALAGVPLSSLCLHDCKLGGGGGAAAPGGAAATEAAAAGTSDPDEVAAAMVGQLAAPGAFQLLRELDVSGNRLQVPHLLALLGALTAAAARDAVGAGEEQALLPCPRLRLLVVAANPGAAEQQVSDAIERLQEARPGLDVVRRAADTGEGGLMN